MAIDGKIFGITDPKSFFQAVLLGNAPTGFVPLSNLPFQISMIGLSHTTPPIDQRIGGTIDSANCSFTFPDFPPGSNVQLVAINLSLGRSPVYRSTVFSYERALKGGLDIYIHQPSGVAISAGEISSNMPGSSNLPKDTFLQTLPWGIWAFGDQQGADIQFGFAFVPHTSTNLNVWAEVVIHGWNIHVGFPADCKVTAHQIRIEIEQALANATSPLNVFIKGQIMKALGNIAGSFAGAIFDVVSITFTSIKLQMPRLWAISDTSNGESVISIGPTIGYPQKW